MKLRASPQGKSKSPDFSNASPRDPAEPDDNAAARLERNTAVQGDDGADDRAPDNERTEDHPVLPQPDSNSATGNEDR